MREKKNFNHMRAKERNTKMLQQYDWKFKTKKKKKKKEINEKKKHIKSGAEKKK